MVTTARTAEEQDCALRALNVCDGALSRDREGLSCLCQCANRDFMAAVGWDGASEGYERDRLAALALVVLGEERSNERRS